MEGIALYSKWFYITWQSVIIVLAVVTGIAVAFFMSRSISADSRTILAASALSLCLAPLFSKIVYWYCSPSQYSGLWQALTEYGFGGRSLFGAMIGVLLSLLAAAFLTGSSKDILTLLDCVSPAAALMISIGRLSAVFGRADYGKTTYDAPKKQHFPISLEVAEASGNTAWRFPTFFYESLAALVIFVLLTVIFIRRRELFAQRIGSGVVALMFGTMFSCAQIVLESTRYDSLFLRSNGFVSLFQIVGGIMIAAAFTILSIKVSRSGENMLFFVIPDFLALAMLANAGWMEYLIQRYAASKGTYYAIMSVCMFIVFAAACYLYILTEQNDKAALRSKE